jgi:hypothetical protein
MALKWRSANAETADTASAHPLGIAQIAASQLTL